MKMEETQAQELIVQWGGQAQLGCDMGVSQCMDEGVSDMHWKHRRSFHGYVSCNVSKLANA